MSGTLVYYCYLRRRAVYIPTTGKADEGFFRHVEPVAVVPVADTIKSRRAFRETIARGNPLLPPMTPSQRLASPILKKAGLKSWAAFERGTSVWVLEDKDAIYQ